MQGKTNAALPKVAQKRGHGFMENSPVTATASISLCFLPNSLQPVILHARSQKGLGDVMDGSKMQHAAAVDPIQPKADLTLSL